MTEGVENESEIHAALLLYKAKALRRLNLKEAAGDVLSKVLRRKKDRSDDLLYALRYERALAYEDLGQHKRARSELENSMRKPRVMKIWPQDWEYEEAVDLPDKC